MEAVDEALIKQSLYDRTGVLYLYPFSRYTLSLSNHEANHLKLLAGQLNITIHILPKKVFYNSQTNEAVAYDWFLDHDVCPFLKGMNDCLIYKDRPSVCRAFPGKLAEDKGVELLSAKFPREKISYNVLVENAKKALLLV